MLQYRTFRNMTLLLKSKAWKHFERVKNEKAKCTQFDVEGTKCGIRQMLIFQESENKIAKFAVLFLISIHNENTQLHHMKFVLMLENTPNCDSMKLNYSLSRHDK